MDRKTGIILIIEKNPDIAGNIGKTLHARGFKTVTAATPEEISRIAESEYIILLLIALNSINSDIDADYVKHLVNYRNLPAVFMYSDETPEMFEYTLDIASYGYVMKHAADIVLFSSISTAIKLHETSITSSGQVREIAAMNEELQAAMDELESANEELINTYKNLESSESKYRSLHESLMDAVIMIDMKAGIIEVNKSFQNLTGYSREELLKMKYHELTPPEWAPFENSIYKNQLLKRGYSEIYEKEIIHKDGSRVPVEMRAFMFSDQEGHNTGTWAIVRDITERRNTADKLKGNEINLAETNYMLQLVLDTIPARIFWLDKNLKYIGCNKICAQDNGLSSPSEISGLDDHKLFPAELADLLDKDNLSIINSGDARLNYEEHIKFPNMPYQWLRTSKVPLRNMSGEIIGLLGTYENIDERKKAQEALDLSEKTLKSMLDATPIGVALLMDRVIQKVNAGACHITGYSEEEIIGQSIRMMYSSENEFINAGDELYSQMIAKGLSTKEIPVRKKDGTLIDVLTTITPIDINNYEAGVCVTIMDITERKRAVEALDRSEKILKSMLDSTPIGVCLLVDRKFQRVNSAQCRITGYSEDEIVGQSTQLIYPNIEEFENDGEQLYGQMHEKGLGSKELHIKRKDGTVIDALVTVIPIDRDNPGLGIVSTVMDITEQKRAVQALVKSENLLRNFLEEVMEGIAILDPDGLITFWNNICSVMTGIPSHDAIGKYWWEIALRLEPDELKLSKLQSGDLTDQRLFLKEEYFQSKPQPEISMP
jgi:PAS domain S-box-containing protein